jgi:hypothetical protein
MIHPYSIPFHSTPDAEAIEYVRSLVASALPLITDPRVLDASASFLVTNEADVANHEAFRYPPAGGVDRSVTNMLHDFNRHMTQPRVPCYLGLRSSLTLEISCENLIRYINDMQ